MQPTPSRHPPPHPTRTRHGGRSWSIALTPVVARSRHSYLSRGRLCLHIQTKGSYIKARSNRIRTRARIILRIPYRPLPPQWESMVLRTSMGRYGCPPLAKTQTRVLTVGQDTKCPRGTPATGIPTTRRKLCRQTQHLRTSSNYRTCRRMIAPKIAPKSGRRAK